MAGAGGHSAVAGRCRRQHRGLAWNEALAPQDPAQEVPVRCPADTDSPDSNCAAGSMGKRVKGWFYLCILLLVVKCFISSDDLR